MAQHTTIALLATLTLLVLAAGSVRAAIVTDLPFDRWQLSFFPDGLGTPSDTGACLIVTDALCPGEQFQVTVNGQNKGLTSTPVSDPSCPLGVGIDAALTKPEFSKGYYDLQPGASSVVFKMVAGDVQQAGYFKVKTGSCDNAPYKVVTNAGKVRTRAAAAAACQAQNRELARVTSTNWDQVVKVVRESPAINLSVFDAVIIDSYNGNPFAGIDLELVVSKFGATVSMLVFPGYPLCAKTSA
ncbi:hypothetical protein GGF32_004646 [Allomyces javanicus]|nr:hypothetical protein GGF32_004646 [Allomyces javanicus]